MLFAKSRVASTGIRAETNKKESALLGVVRWRRGPGDLAGATAYHAMWPRHDVRNIYSIKHKTYYIRTHVYVYYLARDFSGAQHCRVRYSHNIREYNIGSRYTMLDRHSLCTIIIICYYRISIVLVAVLFDTCHDLHRAPNALQYAHCAHIIIIVLYCSQICIYSACTYCIYICIFQNLFSRQGCAPSFLLPPSSASRVYTSYMLYYYCTT